jgi:hypothetical protein
MKKPIPADEPGRGGGGLETLPCLRSYKRYVGNDMKQMLLTDGSKLLGNICKLCIYLLFNIKTANVSSANVANVTYFAKTVTNKILIHEKIKADSVRVMLATIRSREKRNAYRILVGTSEGKRPLGRPKT